LKELVPKPKQVECIDAQEDVATINPVIATEEVVEQSSSKKGYRLLWSQLLQRVFKVDVEKCPRCQGKMKPISVIQDPVAIEKICVHLGLPTSLIWTRPQNAREKQSRKKYGCSLIFGL